MSSRSRATSSSASRSEGARRGRTARLADRVALAIATGGGAGYAPLAPGTMGSALAALAIWLLPFSGAGLALVFLVVTAGGVWAAHRAEPLLGEKDPSAIVIDEVAGMTLAVLLVPRTPAAFLAAFAVFRFFDIVKPFPAGVSQRLPGGAGVVADDLIAGGYTLGALALAGRVLGWP